MQDESGKHTSKYYRPSRRPGGCGALLEATPCVCGRPWADELAPGCRLVGKCTRMLSASRGSRPGRIGASPTILRELWAARK